MSEPPPRRCIGVVFGGRSAEHDVSCASGLSVLRALDPSRFDAVAIGMTRNGAFVVPPRDAVATAVAGDASRAANAIADHIDAAGAEVCFVRSDNPGRVDLVLAEGGARVATLDVVFPVLHGPYGEDGTIQGLFETLGVPYVGSGVLGSAVGMDKVAMKRALRADGVPVGPYRWFSEDDWREDTGLGADVLDELGTAVFVKPANLGSSVGISRVDSAEALEVAVEEALRYDDCVVVEAELRGREIECGVLGGRRPLASRPGEITVAGGWYDYAAKYLDAAAAQLHVPADLPPEWETRIRDLALDAFRAVGCWGLARVDFFCDPPAGAVWVNEVNTMPGFTSISMYSKMWAASGRDYASLVAELIDLAFDRHRLVARRSATP
ncbi:MAG: D-alanine--D-alanine ligase [Acidimicrobiia bacterium]|nr:D-alanine--D-alanine ligase [Acidimicrobiia bacterium]